MSRSLRGLTVDDAKMNNVTSQPLARVDHCVLICTHMRDMIETLPDKPPSSMNTLIMIQTTDTEADKKKL